MLDEDPHDASTRFKTSSSMILSVIIPFPPTQSCQCCVFLLSCLLSKLTCFSLPKVMKSFVVSLRLWRIKGLSLLMIFSCFCNRGIWRTHPLFRDVEQPCQSENIFAAQILTLAKLFFEKLDFFSGKWYSWSSGDISLTNSCSLWLLRSMKYGMDWKVSWLLVRLHFLGCWWSRQTWRWSWVKWPQSLVLESSSTNNRMISSNGSFTQFSHLWSWEIRCLVMFYHLWKQGCAWRWNSYSSIDSQSSVIWHEIHWLMLLDRQMFFSNLLLPVSKRLLPIFLSQPTSFLIN